MAPGFRVMPTDIRNGLRRSLHGNMRLGSMRGRGFCHEHKKRRDKKRDTSWRKFYTVRFAKHDKQHGSGWDGMSTGFALQKQKGAAYGALGNTSHPEARPTVRCPA